MFSIIEDKEKWDLALKKVSSYDFYHTYEYHSLSKKGDEKPILIYYEDKKYIIAIPFIKTPIEGTDYNDLISVYGYPGPITSNLDSNYNNESFQKHLNSFLLEENIVSVFSRLNPFIENQLEVLKNLGQIQRLGPVVNINLTLDIQSQRAEYSKTTKRYLNKVRKSYYFETYSNDNDIDVFMDLYYSTMDRVGAKKSYYFDKAYFTKFLNSEDFTSELVFAKSYEENEVAAGAIMVKTNNIVQYHLSGTKLNHLKNTPIRLLFDETRLKATEERYKYFNLGGGVGGNEDSLFKFKSSFSKDYRTFSIWKYIVQEKLYDMLCAEKVSGYEFKDDRYNGDYFPLYRM